MKTEVFIYRISDEAEPLRVQITTNNGHDILSSYVSHEPKKILSWIEDRIGKKENSHLFFKDPSNNKNLVLGREISFFLRKLG